MRPKPRKGARSVVPEQMLITKEGIEGLEAEVVEKPLPSRAKSRALSVAPVDGRAEELDGLLSLKVGSLEAGSRIQEIEETGEISPDSDTSLSEDLDLLVVVFQHFWTTAIGRCISYMSILYCAISHLLIREPPQGDP